MPASNRNMLNLRISMLLMKSQGATRREAGSTIARRRGDTRAVRGCAGTMRAENGDARHQGFNVASQHVGPVHQHRQLEQIAACTQI